MATITSIKNGMIAVDETPLRASGGGQPADKGTLTSAGKSATIVDVVKKDGILYHKLEKSLDVSEGDTVEITLDQERRDILTRMHTAEHVLFGALERECKDAGVIKINLSLEESSIFITAPELTWDMLIAAEKRANEIIAENRPIIEHHIEKNKVEEHPKLRIKIDRITENTVRAIEIKDFDFSACCGTHCENTGAIGIIHVSSLSSTGMGKYEVRFRIDAHALFEQAGQARQVSSLLNAENVLESVTRLQQNNNIMKQQLRELAKSALQHVDSEQVGDVILYHGFFEGIEKKQLVDRAAELAKEGNVFVALINNTDNQLILAASLESGKDASEVLKQLLPQIGGKGGGRQNFAMCGFDAAKAETILPLLRQLLYRFCNKT